MKAMIRARLGGKRREELGRMSEVDNMNWEWEEKGDEGKASPYDDALK